MDKTYRDFLDEKTDKLLYRFIELLLGWYGVEINIQKFVNIAVCRKIYEVLADIKERQKHNELLIISETGYATTYELDEEDFAQFNALMDEAYRVSDQ